MTSISLRRTLARCCLCFVALVALSAHADTRNLAVASTEKRVALVIGNAAYGQGRIEEPGQ